VVHIAHEWTRGLAHTNSIENFWSLFKRSISGQFHSISVKHMGKYVDETAYKFNRRGTEYFPETVARLVNGTPFPYRTLIETTESSSRASAASRGALPLSTRGAAASSQRLALTAGRSLRG
jgi:hypothetical protein